MRVAQPRHRHDHRLALLQRDAAGVGLGRVGVGLDHPGPLPEPVAGELLGRQLRPGEVRDPPLGARKAGHALAVHRLPDLLADLVLGAHAAKHIRPATATRKRICREERLRGRKIPLPTLCASALEAFEVSPTGRRMGRKTQIAIVVAVLVLVLGAIGAYAYDSSQKDKIADGVTIGGVDVGGLDASRGRSGPSATSCSRRCATRSGSASTGRRWELPGQEPQGAAPTSTPRSKTRWPTSRDGGLPGRLVRYVTGGSVDKQVSADVTYSQPAVNRFVRQVAAEVEPRGRRTPRSAPSADSLDVVAAHERAQAARPAADPAARRRGAQRRRPPHDRRPQSTRPSPR